MKFNKELTQMLLWSKLLSRADLEIRYEAMAKVDKVGSEKMQAFYESRTLRQLDELAHTAWRCEDGETYQIANSYRHLLFDAKHGKV